MPREVDAEEDRQVEIDGELAHRCPGCSERPDAMAVYAGTEARCGNDDCLVITYKWWSE